MNIKIPYAFDKDTKELVHVSTVPTGKNCNCFCITCGEDLIAKNNGKIKVSHFSHSTESNCDSRETLLHFFTKHLFKNLSEIYVPEYRSKTFYGFAPQLIKLKNAVVIDEEIIYRSLGKKCLFTNVRIEKKMAAITPDIIADININGKTYEFIIEIAVTHFIDDKKKQYIIENNINCIEIDLSSLYESNILWNEDNINENILKPHFFRLINENFLDHDQLLLDYEISYLLNGFVRTNRTTYLLTEDFFIDKKKWLEIENRFSPQVIYNRYQFTLNEQEIIQRHIINEQNIKLKKEFEIKNFQDYEYMEVILEVPYKEKDNVKNSGAKWNANIKKWYINAKNPAVEILWHWVPNNYKFTIKLNIPLEDVEEAKNLGAKWDNINNNWYIIVFEPVKASFLPYAVVDNNAVYFEKWINKNKMEEINQVSHLYVKDPNKNNKNTIIS